MKGWVGLVGWPTADGLPLVVTRQPQVERRTAKVRLSETDVLPLSHASGGGGGGSSGSGSSSSSSSSSSNSNNTNNQCGRRVRPTRYAPARL